MEERLVVKNFGPIKDVDIRIGKLTVLIGEQATGKSTLGKLLAVCKDFDAIVPNGMVPSINTALHSYGLGDSLNPNTKVHYNDENYSLEITATESIISLENSRPGENDSLVAVVADSTTQPKSELFNSLFKEFSSLSKDEFSYNIDWETRQKFYKNRVYPNVQDAFYIPTERFLQSIVTLGKEGIGRINDKLFWQLSQIEAVQRLAKEDTLIAPLNVHYKNQNGIGYFRKEAEEKYQSMQNAASGYQSTIPIVLLIEYFTKIQKKKKTFIIEEPELNLFPTTQHHLMQYLVSNLNKTENQILITTHSPYVLAALNNMLSAYKSGQVDKERTEAILPADYWLNADEVTAYRLMPDGTAKDLMNREMSLLHSEEIDEVSGDINQQFDELITIQLEAENG